MVGKNVRQALLEITEDDFKELLKKLLSRLFLTEKALYLARGYKEMTQRDILQYYMYALQDFLEKDLGFKIIPKNEKEG